MIINVGKNEYRDDVELKAGERVWLIKHTYVGPSNCHHRNQEWKWWMIPFADYADGVPTNGGGKRTSGWLGTTNDWHAELEGAFVIDSVGVSRLLDRSDEVEEGVFSRKARLEISAVDED